MPAEKFTKGYLDGLLVINGIPPDDFHTLVQRLKDTEGLKEVEVDTNEQDEHHTDLILYVKDSNPKEKLETKSYERERLARFTIDYFKDLGRRIGYNLDATHYPSLSSNVLNVHAHVFGQHREGCVDLVVSLMYK